jgi:hypothetical protein
MPLIADGAEFMLKIKAPERKTAVGIGQATSYYDHLFEFLAKYDNGTGANKVDAVWSGRLSGTQSLDLRGSLTSVLDGSVVSFPVITGLFFKNLSSTPAEILTIGASTNPFITWLAATGDGVKLDPSGFFALYAPLNGYATTAGTADILTLTAASGSPSWEGLILGRSA